jgi:hypothetical protein
MAGLVEKVSAQVVYEFPLVTAPKSSLGHKIPVSSLTIKEFEDFLFNARMRGATDETPCTINSKRFWDGYKHEDMPHALAVGVNAYMDGMPLMTTETPAQKKASIHWPTLAVQVVITAIVFIILMLVF